jgi:hypothetical protein
VAKHQIASVANIELVRAPVGHTVGDWRRGARHVDPQPTGEHQSGSDSQHVGGSVAEFRTAARPFFSLEEEPDPRSRVCHVLRDKLL